MLFREFIVRRFIVIATLFEAAHTLNDISHDTVSENHFTENNHHWLEKEETMCLHYLRKRLSQFLPLLDRNPHMKDKLNVEQEVGLHKILNAKLLELMGQCNGTEIGVTQYVVSKVENPITILPFQQFVTQKIKLKPYSENKVKEDASVQNQKEKNIVLLGENARLLENPSRNLEKDKVAASRFLGLFGNSQQKKELDMVKKETATLEKLARQLSEDKRVYESQMKYLENNMKRIESETKLLLDIEKLKLKQSNIRETVLKDELNKVQQQEQQEKTETKKRLLTIDEKNKKIEAEIIDCSVEKASLIVLLETEKKNHAVTKTLSLKCEKDGMEEQDEIRTLVTNATEEKRTLETHLAICFADNASMTILFEIQTKKIKEAKESKIKCEQELIKSKDKGTQISNEYNENTRILEVNLTNCLTKKENVSLLLESERQNFKEMNTTHIMNLTLCLAEKEMTAVVLQNQLEFHREINITKHECEGEKNKIKVETERFTSSLIEEKNLHEQNLTHCLAEKASLIIFFENERHILEHTNMERIFCEKENKRIEDEYILFVKQSQAKELMYVENLTQCLTEKANLVVLYENESKNSQETKKQTEANVTLCLVERANLTVLLEAERKNHANTNTDKIRCETKSSEEQDEMKTLLATTMEEKRDIETNLARCLAENASTAILFEIQTKKLKETNESKIKCQQELIKSKDEATQISNEYEENNRILEVNLTNCLAKKASVSLLLENERQNLQEKNATHIMNLTLCLAEKASLEVFLHNQHVIHQEINITKHECEREKKHIKDEAERISNSLTEERKVCEESLKNCISEKAGAVLLFENERNILEITNVDQMKCEGENKRIEEEAILFAKQFEEEKIYLWQNVTQCLTDNTTATVLYENEKHNVQEINRTKFECEQSKARIKNESQNLLNQLKGQKETLQNNVTYCFAEKIEIGALVIKERQNLREKNKYLYKDAVNCMATTLRDTPYPGATNYTRYSVARLGMNPLTNVTQLRPEFGSAINDVSSFRYTISIPNCRLLSSKRQIFIAVLSNDFNKRTIIRQTWKMNFRVWNETLTGLVGFAFILLRSENSLDQKKIIDESNNYGDIIQIDMAYSKLDQLTQKSFGLLNWLNVNCNNPANLNFILMVNENVYVNLRSLEYFVHYNSPLMQSMFGASIEWNRQPNRDPSRIDYDSYEDWPWKDYPPYLWWEAIIFTNNTISPLLAAYQTTPTTRFDYIYLTGICPQKANVKIEMPSNPMSVSSLPDANHPKGCDIQRTVSWFTYDFISAHKENEDFYLDFNRKCNITDSDGKIIEVTHYNDPLLML